MEKVYQLGLYEKAMPSSLSYEEALRTAAKCGFDFVEISVDETDEKLKRLDYSRTEIQRLNNIMSETGICFRSMCLSGHRKYPLGSMDEKIRSKSLEIMEKAVVLASALGIRIIQLAGYDVYYEQGNEETKNFFASNLQKAVDMAAKAGIMLGFETMETEFMDTTEKAMHYVKAIHSPYLGVYPDLGNITNAACKYKTDVLSDLETGRGHLIAMHLKETVSGKYREIPFGTGHVDFEGGIQKAWQLGVRRFVAEMWYTGNPSWENDIRDAHAMLSAILDKQQTG